MHALSAGQCLVNYNSVMWLIVFIVCLVHGIENDSEYGICITLFDYPEFAYYRIEILGNFRNNHYLVFGRSGYFKICCNREYD